MPVPWILLCMLLLTNIPSSLQELEANEVVIELEAQVKHITEGKRTTFGINFGRDVSHLRETEKSRLDYTARDISISWNVVKFSWLGTDLWFFPIRIHWWTKLDKHSMFFLLSKCIYIYLKSNVASVLIFSEYLCLL